jgi:hypothetical protein
MSPVQPNNQASHVPPYYYFAEDQEQKLQSLWTKKRSWRSLFSRSR